ncbi:hypothetical protein EGD17_05505 [Salmonella enterica]|nr:hypothetical protein [Salmonella enterica]
MGMKQIWDGENLPPVGCDVLIHLASINKWVPHKVEGYEIWPSTHENDTAHHRIQIKLDGNMRLLCDVRPVDWREPD